MGSLRNDGITDGMIDSKINKTYISLQHTDERKERCR